MFEQLTQYVEQNQITFIYTAGCIFLGFLLYPFWKHFLKPLLRDLVRGCLGYLYGIGQDAYLEETTGYPSAIRKEKEEEREKANNDEIKRILSKIENHALLTNYALHELGYDSKLKGKAFLYLNENFSRYGTGWCYTEEDLQKQLANPKAVRAPLYDIENNKLALGLDHSKIS